MVRAYLVRKSDLGIDMKCLLLTLAVAALIFIAGCKSSAPSEYSGSDGNTASANNCSEPENPYEEGSGHYAGFEWAERTGAGTCDGNSQSFIEGCEEYQNQEADYEECEANRQN
jgi:hypothetical protein